MVEQGYHVPEAEQTVDAYVCVVARHGGRANLKPSTVREYRQRARDYIIPAVGDVKLNDLRRQHVLEVHRYARARGVSAATVERVHNVLRSTLSYAEGDLIPHYPARGRKAGPPKADAPVEHFAPSSS